MIATLIGMPSIAQVASSWLVIWKQPSPSIAHTRRVRAGRPWRPSRPGPRSPWCPAPPELIQVPRLLVVDELGRPHLVLADAGHVRRPPGRRSAPIRSITYCGARLPSLRLVVAERVVAAPLVRAAAHQSASVGAAGRARARRGTAATRSAMTSLAVADDRHVGAAVLGDLGRVDVRVHDQRVGREGVAACRSPGRRTGRRARRAGRPRCSAPTAATVPCMPGMPRCSGCAVGERAARHQRGDHRDAGQLGQVAQLLGGASALITPPPT